MRRAYSAFMLAVAFLSFSVGVLVTGIFAWITWSTTKEAQVK